MSDVKNQGESSQSDAQTYACGLLVEECGEILQLIGKAIRFGIDTPGPDGTSARQRLNAECGDVLAAIDYGVAAGVIDARVRLPPKIKDFAKYVDEDFSLNILMIACSKTTLIVGETIKKAMLPKRMFPQVNPSNINLECLSLIHMINLCEQEGILDADVVAQQRHAKFAKLLDPNAVDNLGRRLAPAIED